MGLIVNDILLGYKNFLPQFGPIVNGNCLMVKDFSLVFSIPLKTPVLVPLLIVITSGLEFSVF